MRLPPITVGGKQSRHAEISRRPLGRMVDRVGEWQAGAIRRPGSAVVEVSGFEDSRNLRFAGSSPGHRLTGWETVAGRRSDDPVLSSPRPGMRPARDLKWWPIGRRSCRGRTASRNGPERDL